jgi:hypothetical protein
MSAKDQPPFLKVAGRLCGWFSYFTWRDAGTPHDEGPVNIRETLHLDRSQQRAMRAALRRSVRIVA